MQITGLTNEAHEISKFFTLSRYRRQGVGRSTATRLFDAFTGTWEIAVMKANTPAQHFWRAVVSDYTRRKYEEFFAHYGTTYFVVFRLSGGRSDQ
jgi:predicted acetyltransferase